MSEQGSPRVAGISLHRSIKQARSVARWLWTRLRESLDAYRRAWVAAFLYTELSRLSDAELSRRGLTRDSLYRHVNEMEESWPDGA